MNPVGSILGRRHRLRGLITSMNNDACLLFAVGLLVTPKFDTFYRVFKKAFENKRSSKPFGLLPFGASLQIRGFHGFHC
jgi:hypothetical protein